MKLIRLGRGIETEMQARVDIQAYKDKHKGGFEQSGLKVHELVVEMLVVLEGG